MKTQFCNAIFSGLIISLLFSCESKNQETKSTVDTTSTKVEIPSMINGNDQGYNLAAYGIELSVDPQIGGRITSLKVNGQAFLTGKDVHESNYGSTFWTSPQSSWGWPPRASMDSRPYQSKVLKDSTSSGNIEKLELTSERDSMLNVIIKKIISLNADSTITVEYLIVNDSDKEIKIAPWEITRVAKGGTAFYPKGDVRFDFSKQTLVHGISGIAAKDSAGITSFTFDEKNSKKLTGKLFADGKEGWLAYRWNGNYLIKKFEDVPKSEIAPNEGEIELFTDKQFGYVEIEQQGRFQAIPSKNTYSWKVTWIPRTKVETSSPVEFVRNTLKK